MKARGRFLWVLVCLLVACEMSTAQVTTGTILGTVSDSTGAVIPGATVTIRNVETGITRTAPTDAAGRYRTPQLGLGNYEITAEAAGFQSQVRTGITLTVGREAVVDFAMQVGAVAEKITVTGEAPMVQTTNATVASLVDEATMRDLPLNGRSFADLTSLQAGVVSDLEVQTPGYNIVYSGGGPAVRRSIGGAKPSQSTYLVDGLEISTASTGTPSSSVVGQQLGVDAIREFSVLQSNYGAQYGRAAGGVVNAVTQSGTNEFHGTVFHFLRNESLDARDYFLSSKFPKAPFKQNQFGASLGGPIVKDNTFFFLNYEGLRFAAGEPFLGRTPTPQTRLGRITDASGQVFRTVSVSPDVQHIIKALPLPNGAFLGAGQAELSAVYPWRGDENYGIVRIDQQLSDKDSLFGRFTKDVSSRTDQMALQIPGGFISQQVGGYVLGAISWTRIINPTILNTARVGYSRRNDHIGYNYTNEGEFFPKGHPDLDPRWSCVNGVPLCRIGGDGSDIYGQVGPRAGGPARFTDNTFDYDNSVMINQGGHSITVGGNVKRYQSNSRNEPWAQSGPGFQTIERFLQNLPRNMTVTISTPAPGVITYNDSYRGWRQTYGSFYFQNDFQVRPGLTLNLGARWEWLTGMKEVNGKISRIKNLFTDPGFTQLTKEDSLWEVRDGLKGFSPRVGFAWSADQKTVLRGGYGIFKEMPLLYTNQLALESFPHSRRLLLQDDIVAGKPVLKYPFPFSDPAVLTRGAVGDALIAPPVVKMPYAMQWTFSVERQLGEGSVAKVNYIGTRGVNVFAVEDPNQALTQVINGRHVVPVDVRVNRAFGEFRMPSPISNQWYNGVQWVLEQRLRGGFRFNTSYTLSRNIDNGGGGGVKGSENIQGTSFNVRNQYDRAGDKGLSALHVKHNFILAYTYELPFGAGRRWGSTWPAVANYLLGGWVINGSNTLRSGTPADIGGFGDVTCRQGCDGIPDLKPGGDNNPVLENWTPEQYFDYTQFVMQPPKTFGNLGRNTLIRPGVVNTNFSLRKDTRLGEEKNLEFRAEFFNVLNRPNFSGPGTGVFRNAAGELNPNVGKITTTSTRMRQIQFGLKLTF